MELLRVTELAWHTEANIVPIYINDLVIHSADQAVTKRL